MMGESQTRASSHIWLGLMRLPTFMVFWSGRVVSLLGDMLFSMATMWYVLGKTRSALDTAVVVLIPMLTQLFVSQAFATMADRLPKKAAMVSSDVFRGIVVLTVGTLMAFDHAGTFGIYAASFLLTMAAYLFGPAQNAVLPKMLRVHLISKMNLILPTVMVK